MPLSSRLPCQVGFHHLLTRSGAIIRPRESSRGQFIRIQRKRLRQFSKGIKSERSRKPRLGCERKSRRSCPKHRIRYALRPLPPHPAGKIVDEILEQHRASVRNVVGFARSSFFRKKNERRRRRIH